MFYLALGDNCTVLCVVLLPATSDSTVEPYEAEVGRHLMHGSVDWSSDALAVMGIHARVQGRERLSTAVDGEFGVSGCKHICPRQDHTATSILSSLRTVCVL